MGKHRVITASYLGVLAYAAFIFLGAGRLRYWQGALYVLLALAGTSLTHALSGAAGQVAQRRMLEARAGERWDKRLLAALFVASVVTFVVAGMDSGRFGWSGTVPVEVTVAGALLMLAGQCLFALARRENAFFSSTVRIQSEHGHAVCESGPYRFVRHPGYLGMLLAQLAFPLVLNSWWAFIPNSAAIALLVLRTALEDRYLGQALAGYSEYATRTRWQLLPGLF